MNYHTAKKDFRYVSLWTDGIGVAMALLHKEGDRLRMLEDWRSRSQPMSFNFVQQINQWQEKGDIEKVIVNSLPAVENDSHPVKRMMQGDRRVEVKPAILPFEGMAAYQAKLERFEFQGYAGGGAQLKELIATANYSLDAMAFLQAIAHEPNEIYVPASHAPSEPNPYLSMW